MQYDVHSYQTNPRVILRCAIGGRGEGRIIEGRVSVSQILCDIVVRTLFGGYKDLHGYALGCVFARLYHAKGFG